jgi:hypothetical protein
MVITLALPPLITLSGLQVMVITLSGLQVMVITLSGLQVMEK